MNWKVSALWHTGKLYQYPDGSGRYHACTAQCVCLRRGRESQEIAAALLRTKTIGAAYNGSEEVEVTEPVSGQVYTVKFDRAKEVVLFCRVTVKNRPDAQTLIPAAVEARQTAIPGMAGWWSGGKFHRLRFLPALTPLSRGCLSTVLNYPQTAHTGHRIFIR